MDKCAVLPGERTRFQYSHCICAVVHTTTCKQLDFSVSVDVMNTKAKKQVFMVTPDDEYHILKTAHVMLTGEVYFWLGLGSIRILIECK